MWVFGIWFQLLFDAGQTTCQGNTHTHTHTQVPENSKLPSGSNETFPIDPDMDSGASRWASKSIAMIFDLIWFDLIWFIFYVDSQNENLFMNGHLWCLSPRRTLESWMTLCLIWILYFPFVFSVLNVNLQISGSVPCVWRERTAFCFSLRLMLFLKIRVAQNACSFLALNASDEFKFRWNQTVQCTEWTESKTDRVECFWCYGNELKDWVQTTSLISD